MVVVNSLTNKVTVIAIAASQSQSHRVAMFSAVANPETGQSKMSREIKSV